MRGIWSHRHPIISTRTVIKEKIKHTLGRLGNNKYRMHGTNRVMQKSFLRDGSHIYEFMRFNPHWGGVSIGETGQEIGQVLSRAMFRSLIHRQGLAILYTHLGKIRDPRRLLPASAVGGFRRLAQEGFKKRILVTTTRRLLGYSRALREISYTARNAKNELIINIDARSKAKKFLGELERTDLCGLTFYVPDPNTTRVMMNGHDVLAVQRNGPDQTGRCSVSIPWPRLEFPTL
jgi:hypothetical protein